MSDIYSISGMRLQDCADGVLAALHRGDTVAAMRWVSATLDALREISLELVDVGVHEGLTQAEMARALDIPVSTLRGVRRSVDRV